MDPLGALQSIISVANYLRNAADKAKQNQAECHRLADHLDNVLTMMKTEIQKGAPPDVTQRLKKLKSTLVDLNWTLDELAEQSMLKKLLWRDQIAGKISEAYRDLDDAIKIFHLGTKLDLRRFQAENESARRVDTEALHSALQEVQQNDHEIIKHMEVHNAQMQEAMLALHRRFLHIEDNMERKFLEKGMYAMQRRSGGMKSIPDHFVITSLDVVVYHDRKLGEGGFGEVFEGNWQGSRVAVKVFDKNIPSFVFQKEINVWKALRHPHILEFFGACAVASPPFSVCAIKAQGDALNFLHHNPSADRVKLLHEASIGLQYLHQNSVVHGDLKASNILVDEHGTACLCDFGLSKIRTHTTTVRDPADSKQGTPRWMSPEQMMLGIMNKPSDIYSFGMSIYEIFSGVPPFANTTDSLLFTIVVDHGLRPPRPTEPEAIGLTDNMWNLIEDCWKQDPNQRPIAPIIASQLGEERKRSNIPEPQSSSDLSVAPIRALTVKKPSPGKLSTRRPLPAVPPPLAPPSLPLSPPAPDSPSIPLPIPSPSPLPLFIPRPSSPPRSSHSPPQIDTQSITSTSYTEDTEVSAHSLTPNSLQRSDTDTTEVEEIFGTLIVVILKARNLRLKSKFGTQDPYCTLHYNGKMLQSKTVICGGEHPEWDEEHRFELQSYMRGENLNDRDFDYLLGGTKMGIRCYAEDLVAPFSIGEAVVDLTEVLQTKESDEWYALENNGQKTGEIYLEMTFWSHIKPANGSTETSGHVTLSKAPAGQWDFGQNKSSTIIYPDLSPQYSKSPTDVASQRYSSYSHDSAIRSQPVTPSPGSKTFGTLVVVILKAKNLRAKPQWDTYCTLCHNGKQVRSKAVKRGGHHAEWDEEHRFELQSYIRDRNPNDSDADHLIGGTIMEMQCFAEDPVTAFLIGEVKIDLKEVLRTGESDEWYFLSLKDQINGNVYLELTFWPHTNPANHDEAFKTIGSESLFEAFDLPPLDPRPPAHVASQQSSPYLSDPAFAISLSPVSTANEKPTIAAPFPVIIHGHGNEIKFAEDLRSAPVLSESLPDLGLLSPQSTGHIHKRTPSWKEWRNRGKSPIGKSADSDQIIQHNKTKDPIRSSEDLATRDFDVRYFVIRTKYMVQDRPVTRKKVVLVGDCVGKTSLIFKWLGRDIDISNEYQSVRIGEYDEVAVRVDFQDLLLAIHDTQGQEDFDRLRPVSYPDTHVVVFMYSVVNRDSRDNVIEKWLPEIQHFLPNAYYLLVGTIIDERGEASENWVSSDEGVTLAREMGALAYRECSSRTGDGINDVLQAISVLALADLPGSQSKTWQRFFSGSSK